jgi:hypothetical protein
MFARDQHLKLFIQKSFIRLELDRSIPNLEYLVLIFETTFCFKTELEFNHILRKNLRRDAMPRFLLKNFG